MVKPYLKIFLLIILTGSFIVSPVAQESITDQDAGRNAMMALDEWRWGVLAYNDGLPGKALLAMERAVSLSPTDPAIQEWLGRTYWRSGLEDAALDVWEKLAAEGNASAYLQKWMGDLKRRVTRQDSQPINDDWIAIASFNGTDLGFKQPAAVKKLGNHSGRMIVSSYGGGNMLILDANGRLLDNIEGGIEGLLRPFDILPISENRLLISEFKGDRLSILSLEGVTKGFRTETWGDTGYENDRFLGPQYMAMSPDGEHVFVSDWGNNRVAKWRTDGTHILNIGKSDSFEGFSGPTGLLCIDERVFVANSRNASIEVFDQFGNYLGPFITDGLTRPEGLSLWNNDILIADGANVLQASLKTGALYTLFSVGEGNHKITTINPVDNGNIAVSDFNADRVYLYTPITTLYSGLDIRLNRVQADAYPVMVVNIDVRDRLGNPIVGLNLSNFRINEGSNPVDQAVIDWQSWMDDSVSIVSVLDTSGGTEEIRKFLRSIDDIRSKFREGDRLETIITEKNPVPWEVVNNTNADTLYKNLTENLNITTAFWESAMRLAANRITPDRNRKAVVVFVSKPPLESDFDKYGLIEATRLMANNGIILYVVYATEDLVSRELNYIVQETGGFSIFLYSPEGSGQIISSLRKIPLGAYTLRWQSHLNTGYGRTFLPVSVEVIYLGKSGRAESGTFAPLE